MAKVITVDGPSGAGKGTVCRILSEKLHFALLDSGAIYRIAALSALRNKVELDSEDALTELAQELDIEFIAGEQATTVLLSGVDVSKAIREEQTGLAASMIAPLPKLRAALLDRQRAFATEQGLVADGRDMGTVVFPDAEHKFFLTASAEERARRRLLQLEASGERHDFESILADIKARDDRDMNRAVAPLKPAEGSVVIDSSELSINEVVQVIADRLQSN